MSSWIRESSLSAKINRQLRNKEKRKIWDPSRHDPKVAYHITFPLFNKNRLLLHSEIQ